MQLLWVCFRGGDSQQPWSIEPSGWSISGLRLLHTLALTPTLFPQGEYTRANAEKLRLEQKQRAARKQTEAGQRATPRWFRRLDGGKEGKDVLYEYVGGYWESRAAGKWDNVKDIFGA